MKIAILGGGIAAISLASFFAKQQKNKRNKHF